MSSDLKLVYYYRRYGDLQVSPIAVPPDTIVHDCKANILKAEQSTSTPGFADLYKIPQEVPLDDFESKLGVLSVSNLGRPLVFDRSMQDIFKPHPKEGHLQFVLVDRGMYQ